MSASAHPRAQDKPHTSSPSAVYIHPMYHALLSVCAALAAPSSTHTMSAPTMPPCASALPRAHVLAEQPHVVTISSFHSCGIHKFDLYGVFSVDIINYMCIA